MKQQFVGSLLASSLLGTNAFTPLPSLSVGRKRNTNTLTLHSPLSAIRTVSTTTTTITTKVTTKRKNKHGLSPEELRATEKAVEMRVEAAIEAKVECGAELSMENLSEQKVRHEIISAEIDSNTNVQFETVVGTIYNHDLAADAGDVNAVQFNDVGAIITPEASTADNAALNASLINSDARDVSTLEDTSHGNINVASTLTSDLTHSLPDTFEDVKVQDEERVLNTLTQKATEPMLNSMAETMMENTESMINKKKTVEAKAERIFAEIMATTSSEPGSEAPVGEVQVIGPQNDDTVQLASTPITFDYTHTMEKDIKSAESVGSQTISDDDEDLSSPDSGDQTNVSMVVDESFSKKGLSVEEIIPDAMFDKNESAVEPVKATRMQDEAVEIMGCVSDIEEAEEIPATIDHVTELISSQEKIHREVSEIEKLKEIEEMPTMVDHSRDALSFEEKIHTEEESQKIVDATYIDFWEEASALTHDAKDIMSQCTPAHTTTKEGMYDSFRIKDAEEIDEIPALTYHIQDMISSEDVISKEKDCDETFEQAKVEDSDEIPAITYDVQDMIASKDQTRAAEIQQDAENAELEKLAKNFLSRRTEKRKSSISKSGGTVDDALAVVEKYAIQGGSSREPVLSVDSVIAEIDSVDAAIAKIRKRQAATAKIQKEYLMKRQLEFEKDQRKRDIISEVNQRALLTRRLEFEVEAASQRATKEAEIKATDDEQKDALDSSKHQAEVALAIAQWYESREFKHDQAFRLLVDLGMVAEHLDPDSSEYDHTQDDGVAPCDVPL